MKLTREEFYQLAKERYGEDFKYWTFCCSLCGFKQSYFSIMSEIKDKGFQISKRYGKLTNENIRELKPNIESECMSPTCDYVAYGLITSTMCERGGLEVDGQFIFNFADQLRAS